MRPETRQILILAALLLSGCQTSQNLPEACAVKPDSGMCRAAHTRYYYDQQRGQCRPFVWGGCGGTVPFNDLDACVSTCGGSSDAPPSPVPTKE